MAFIYAFYLLKTGENRVTFTLNHFRFIPDIHQQAIALGIPVFLSYTGFAMMLFMVNIALVEVAGPDAQLLISAHGILNRVFMLIFLPVIGMMIAFQTFAGFNYGARKNDRVIEVLKVALVATAGYAAVWSTIMIFFSEYLFQLFSTDQALIDAATNISSIVFIGFITVGIAMICPALFQAIGLAKPAAFLNALHTYVLLLPALVLYVMLFNDYGAEGIWWLFPISDGITTIIVGSYTWYFINKLKLN